MKATDSATAVPGTSVFSFGPRRGIFVNVVDELAARGPALSDDDLGHFLVLDHAYRALCAILYNYVPGSGHPGGSISSGRFVQAVLFDALDYDLSNPDAPGADLLSYAAGHKALGLYALWALRNEVARIGNPDLLPASDVQQLRLEDLLGFRRNLINDTPLMRQFHARALDGHPTPATPFVKLATGASGVGIAASFGLALGAIDIYREKAPRVHVVEGEGGMTPGRVAEAFAAAGTMGLRNLVVHVDWNQASIDSNRVCRDGAEPGDYVQWDPVEFAYLHDWNVILVPDGKDYQQIVAAQHRALAMDNGQPTAIVYRTVKGWEYGIEGRASHGAGHKLCASGFYDAVAPLLKDRLSEVPRCEGDAQRCRAAIPGSSRAATGKRCKPSGTCSPATAPPWMRCARDWRRPDRGLPSARAHPGRTRPMSARCTSCARRTRAIHPRSSCSNRARRRRCAGRWPTCSITSTAYPAAACWLPLRIWPDPRRSAT